MKHFWGLCLSSAVCKTGCHTSSSYEGVKHNRGKAEKPRALTRAWPECVQLNSMPTLSSVLAVQLSTRRSPTDSLTCAGVRVRSWILYPAEKGGKTRQSADGLLFSWDHRRSLSAPTLPSPGPSFTYYQSLNLSLSLSHTSRTLHLDTTPILHLDIGFGIHSIKLSTHIHRLLLKFWLLQVMTDVWIIFHLTDNSNDVERGLKRLISNTSLAGHVASAADQMTGNSETSPGVPQRVLPIGMKLLIWILLTDTDIYWFWTQNLKKTKTSTPAPAHLTNEPPYLAI